MRMVFILCKLTNIAQVKIWPCKYIVFLLLVAKLHIETQLPVEHPWDSRRIQIQDRKRIDNTEYTRKITYKAHSFSGFRVSVHPGCIMWDYYFHSAALTHNTRIATCLTNLFQSNYCSIFHPLHHTRYPPPLKKMSIVGQLVALILQPPCSSLRQKSHTNNLQSLSTP